MKFMLKSLLFTALTLTASVSSPSFAKSSKVPEHYVLDAGDSAKISSKTIVLVHGMYLNSKSWDNWKTYYEKEGFKVYALSWPHHDNDIAKLKESHPNKSLGDLELEGILNRYRQFLSQLDEKPILIGHSMGGLVVQLLLQENLGVAGVAIDSAPPLGVVPVESELYKSNWPILNPLTKGAGPILLNENQFYTGFAEGCVSSSESRAFYDEFVAPESRKVGRAPLTLTAKINFSRKGSPLLFIAGGKDKTIPASLNYRNFLKYEKSNSLTEFRVFANSCHLITLQDSWSEVAAYSRDWISKISN